MKRLLLILLISGFSMAIAQEYNPQMLHDPSYNFYEVVKKGEQYFSTHFNGKGSGYKEFRRWIAENESKYYPSGDRSSVDPFFAQHAYEAFLKNNPTQYRLFPNGWNDLGPYSANVITRGYNPGIGRVEAFWVNPLNTQQIYMGSRSGGFWKTNNEGQTWTNTTDFLFATGVNTIAVSPTNPDSVLINIRNGGNGTSHGIYRSTDGGDTWGLTPFNPSSLGWGGLGGYGAIHKIVYHPTIPNMVFVGTSNGIYRSTDNLNTWTQLYPNGSITDIEFHPTNPDIVYIYDNDYQSSFSDQLLISSNGGSSYSPSGTLNGNNGYTCHISVSAAAPNDVYVASTNGVWKSTDSGQNFNFLTNPNESCDGFAVSDLSTQNMIYGYLNLMKSTDGGSNFSQSANWYVSGTTPGPAYTHADLRTAECVNGVFYVGTDGYLAKTTDNGSTWTRLNDGTGIRENYRVGLSQSNWMVQITGSQDNGTSIRDESGWIEWNGGDGMEGIVQPLNDDWMIGSWQYGSRNYTRDGGQTRIVANNPNSGGGNADWIAPLLNDPIDQMKAYHFADSIYYSLDFGKSWEYLAFPTIGNIRLAAIAYNNPDILAVVRNSSLLISTDGGQTFQSKTSGLPGYSITGIAFDPKDDQTIVLTYNRYVNDNNKVYITHNLGNSWSNITHNLGSMPLQAVVIDHTPERNIFVGGEIGVFTKGMNGNNWTPYNLNLPNSTIRDLEIHWGANVLRAATWGRGLWEINLPGRQNYPAILQTSVDQPPTENLPRSGQAQHVTAVISYQDSLSEVFVKWSRDSLKLGQSIPMSFVQDSTWKTDAPIPGFGWDSRIFFKVYAVGSQGDTSETYRFSYLMNPVPPCVPFANGAGDNYIVRVQMAEIDTITLGGSYTDFTSRQIAHVNRNQLYNLVVKITSTGTDTAFGKTWIDWNGDGDFDDLEENYDLGFVVGQAYADPSKGPLAIRVPSHAVLGKVRMRVMMKKGSSPGECDIVFDGETEDYTLDIQAASSCTTTSNAITVSSCGPYIAPSGAIYTSSSTIVDTARSIAGCDSILTINLSVTMIDTSISRNGATLSSNEASASYQWVNCTNGFELINGETGASFTPTQNGNYRLILEKGDCQDTTACMAVMNVANQGIAPNRISIYPNPSPKGKFFLDLGSPKENCSIKITNSTGQLIRKKTLEAGQIHSFQLDVPKGVYLMELNLNGESSTHKLFVE